MGFTNLMKKFFWYEKGNITITTSLVSRLRGMEIQHWGINKKGFLGKEKHMDLFTLNDHRESKVVDKHLEKMDSLLQDSSLRGIRTDCFYETVYFGGTIIYERLYPNTEIIRDKSEIENLRSRNENY